ncbi:hypothetical protein LF63_0108070 [Oleiagrimonas soli]|nr:hypothetical protein LF63_0108070 [Oleiagrimonas soli]
MTPDNVGDFVRRENRAVFQGTTPPTRQDYLAMAATPFRSTFAHFAAQQMVVSRMGHFHDNEYSRSALEGVIG